MVPKMTTRRIVNSLLPEGTRAKRVVEKTNLFSQPRLSNPPYSTSQATTALIATGGPTPEVPQFLRLNWLAGTTRGFLTVPAPVTQEDAEILTISLWIRSTIPVTPLVSLETAEGAYVTSKRGARGIYPTWTNVPVYVGPVPATTGSFSVIVETDNPGTKTSSDTTDVAAVMAVSGDKIVPFFDGDFEHAWWLGAPGKSRAVMVTGIE